MNPLFFPLLLIVCYIEAMAKLYHTITRFFQLVILSNLLKLTFEFSPKKKKVTDFRIILLLTGSITIILEVTNVF